MRALLERVVQRLERHRPVAAREGLADQPVGEPGVLRQQRDRARTCRAPGLVARPRTPSSRRCRVRRAPGRAARVPVPGSSGPRGSRTRRASAGHRRGRTRAARSRSCASGPRSSRGRAGRGRAARRRGGRGRRGRAAGSRRTRRAASRRPRSSLQRGAVALQVVGDQQLVAILAAAEQEEVDLVRRRAAPPRTQRALHELDPAPCAALAQHEHVPAVGVDREVLGVELAQDELHARALPVGSDETAVRR